MLYARHILLTLMISVALSAAVQGQMSTSESYVIPTQLGVSLYHDGELHSTIPQEFLPAENPVFQKTSDFLPLDLWAGQMSALQRQVRVQQKLSFFGLSILPPDWRQGMHAPTGSHSYRRSTFHLQPPAEQLRQQMDEPRSSFDYVVRGTLGVIELLRGQ